MVAIRNQEENDYINNLLPFKKRYYWIGVEKVDELWTWQETNTTVPDDVQNWAADEPDNITVDQNCVEIYVKRADDTGKWNNENCLKGKGTICYSGKALFNFVLLGHTYTLTHYSI